MNTDQVRKAISIKRRKIVNVFAGPTGKSIIVAHVPANCDVQFEFFSESEIGQLQSHQICEKHCEQVVDKNNLKLVNH